MQQTQTLSLRISEALRKRLEDIRKLTAIRKGESVSTSEIAKKLLESAREERFEVVALLSKPTESLVEIRRKGEAGQMLTRAQWTVLAYFVQQGCESFSKNPLSRETWIGILKAFDAAHQLRAKASAQDEYYLGNLPGDCRPERSKPSDPATAELVRKTVAETVRRLSNPATKWTPMLAARNLYVLGTYYPWGEVKGSTNPQNTWSFATYWQDSASGLDYANNRYYSNAYGRFMTPDPSRSSGGPSNPQSWNRYAYVSGDPVNFHDPAGLMEEEVCSSGDGSACDDGGGGGDPTGYCDPSIEDCSSTCVSADGFTPMPGPGCQSGGAPPTQTTTPVPACNTDVPKITTTLNNLASDILGITAQKDAAITPADLLALQATLASDAQNDLGNFNGGHFFLDLSLSSVANDFGGSSTAAYTDFIGLFDPSGNGRRYPNPVATTDPNHSYYLHDHSTNGNQDLTFHFDRYNPYHHFPIGTLQHFGVDVLYGNLGVHCLDPAWRN